PAALAKPGSGARCDRAMPDVRAWRAADLKQIFHRDRLPRGLLADRDPALLEVRRAHAQPRVARKAEAFARDAKEGVEPTVTILIVDQRKRIVAGRHAADPDQRRARRRHRPSDHRRIAAAIRKV